MFALEGLPLREDPVEDWAELKPTTPFGMLPVMIERSDDGEFVLAESGAIMRYLARRFEMYGHDHRQHAMADALADFVADARTKYMAIAYADSIGTSEEAIAMYWAQLPTTLGLLERALQRSTNPAAGWFICDALTFADVATFDYLDALETLRPGCFDGHAGLVAFVAKFRALPSIAPFIAERTRP
jgi:glutathione S-transferase